MHSNHRHGDDDDDDDDDNDEDPNDVPHLMSNLAVWEMLQPRVAARGRHSSGTTTLRHSKLRHRDWVEAKVVEYLQGTAAACTKFATASNAAALQRVLRSRKTAARAAASTTATAAAATAVTKVAMTTGFDLTEAESLQIINLAPTEPVEIHLLVEELHERMTARKQEELLATIQSYYIQKAAPSSSPSPPVRKDNGDKQQHHAPKIEEGALKMDFDDDDDEDGKPFAVKKEEKE